MYPSDAKYTKDHEWIRAEGDTYVVGITAFAAEQLGDVTYVELPEIGAEFRINDEIATVESVKAASDIFSPVAGIVVATNEALEDQPELVNEGPQEQGWFFKLKNVDRAELDALMGANEYEKFAPEQTH
jgi:glycine cleavage system H protein